MALAAVTPDVVEPWEKSRFPDVSFNSSIFAWRILNTSLDISGGFIGWIEFSLTSPLQCTRSLDKSVNSSSFTCAAPEIKYLGRLKLACFRITWSSLSMYSCGLIMTSRYPNPAGDPFSGNIQSNTNGYFPWSYSPVSLYFGSFSVANKTCPSTNLQ